MTTGYKKSEMFNKELFIKPRILFDEAFEKERAAGIPSTRIGRYLETLKSGRYGRYAQFITHHAYAFFYGIMGSLILGIVGGLICMSIGLFFDWIQYKVTRDNELFLQRNIKYEKYKKSLEFQETLKFIFTILAGCLFLAYCYTAIVAFIPSSTWFSFITDLLQPIKNLVPSIHKFEQILIKENKQVYIDQVSHILMADWLIVGLLLFFFLSKLIYLIKTFGLWDVDIYCYMPKRRISFKLLLHLSAAVLLVIGIAFFTFKTSFLGNGSIYPHVGKGSSGLFFVVLSPLIWLSCFMTISLLIIVLLNAFYRRLIRNKNSDPSHHRYNLH